MRHKGAPAIPDASSILNVTFFAAGNRAFPLSFENKSLVLAAQDPIDHSNPLKKIQQVSRMVNIEVRLALRSDINEYLNRMKPGNQPDINNMIT